MNTFVNVGLIAGGVIVIIALVFFIIALRK